LGTLLQRDIGVEPSTNSSFVVEQNDPLLAGLDNAGLYFSEDDDWQQMDFGLTGDWIKGAQVVLEACPADWRKWNYQGEPIKTAALFRSEMEHPAAHAAIAISGLDQ